MADEEEDSSSFKAASSSAERMRMNAASPSLGVLATGALALPAGFSSVHLELTVQGDSLTASIDPSPNRARLPSS